MRISRSFTAAAFALAFAAIMPVGAARAAGTEEPAVRKANDDFYAALNNMFEGNIEPMESVWSHADDVTYMGPDGKFTVGWGEVFGDWQSQAALKLGGHIETEKVNVTVGQDLATVECIEVGENMVNGQPIKVTIRATNVYRKENGTWKMIGHHTDKLPFLQ